MIYSTEQFATTFFPKTLPFIRRLASGAVKTYRKRWPVKLLAQGKPGTVTLSCENAASLLACAFLGIIAQPNGCPQSLDFSAVLQQAPEKTKCLLHYFERRRVLMPERVIQVNRVVLPSQKLTGQLSVKGLLDSKAPLTPFVVKPRPHVIEDEKGTLMADFANKFIGGGVLRGGCVQEEILFLIKPECLVSLFFCQAMDVCESITIVGAERMCKYAGYARSFRFDGDFKDDTLVDSVPGCPPRLATAIVAFDAIVAFRHNQFHPKLMHRELIKTVAAVDVQLNPPSRHYKFDTFATGNWGCGAFGGDIPLKAMLQWLGASETKKRVAYFTFGDRRAAGLEKLVQTLLKSKRTVGWLWRQLLDFYQGQKRQGLFEHLVKVSAL